MSAPAVCFLFAILALFTTPLAASLGLAATAALLAGGAANGAAFTFSLAEFLDSPSLVSIPLFVLAGEMAAASGIAGRLVDLARAVAGGGRPGLGMVLSAVLFACVSGLGPSVAAGVGVACLPAMLAGGTSRERAAGLVAAAGGLGIVIPASMPLTMFAAIAGVNTNHVFAASFVPGAVAAGVMILALAASASGRFAPCRNGEAEAPALAGSARRAVWSLPLPLLLLASLFSGFLTAPEAAAFAAVYAAAIGRFAHGALDGRRLRLVLERSALFASAALAVAASGKLFYLAPGAAGLPEWFASAAAPGGAAWPASAAMVLILLAAGCFLDPASLVVIFAPLFLPLAERIGMREEQLGVLMAFCLAVGLVTPPHAANLAAASGVAGVGARRAFRGALPFVAALILTLAAVAALPGLSSWFPSLFGWGA